ncbi:uncharacterized protein LY79DRAFT_197114 [Colletotrichum navitas]|uniref:Uncharacterized protein n=1 Tax=Colletotrichum navitas TaxID=681940 RepID=A0AAD8PZW2_9PEZI|nr:uncharacterized protein LY79DRAFT_197114 [Colletotrichum navitas]KAK1590678.1 hypothetical protein LY79DRAFT_197114 [Colletotrichum navitas]
MNLDAGCRVRCRAAACMITAVLLLRAVATSNLGRNKISRSAVHSAVQAVRRGGAISGSGRRASQASRNDDMRGGGSCLRSRMSSLQAGGRGVIIGRGGAEHQRDICSSHWVDPGPSSQADDG